MENHLLKARRVHLQDQTENHLPKEAQTENRLLL